eukprot:scaffold383929_cov23-Prasinocladus_malaysianus.AAC.1
MRGLEQDCGRDVAAVCREVKAGQGDVRQAGQVDADHAAAADGGRRGSARCVRVVIPSKLQLPVGIGVRTKSGGLVGGTSGRPPGL